MYCALCKGFMVQCVRQFMQRIYGTMCTKVCAKGLWYNVSSSLCKGFMVQSVLQFIQRVYDTTLLSLCSHGLLFSQTSLSVYSCTCFHSAISCALKVDSRRLFCTCSVIKMALLSFFKPSARGARGLTVIWLRCISTFWGRITRERILILQSFF